MRFLYNFFLPWTHLSSQHPCEVGRDQVLFLPISGREIEAHRGKSLAWDTKNTSRAELGKWECQGESLMNLGTKTFSNVGKFGTDSRKLEMNYFPVLKIRIFVILLKVVLQDYFLSFPFLHWETIISTNQEEELWLHH